MKKATAAAVAGLALTVIGAPTASGESNAVVASASGSGHMVRNGFYRTFSFSAAQVRGRDEQGPTAAAQP